MYPGAHLEAELLGPVEDRPSARHRSSRPVEAAKEPVPGTVHLHTSEASELTTNVSVVAR